MNLTPKGNDRVDINPGPAKRLGKIKKAVLSDEVLPRTQLEDGSFNATFNNVIVNGTFTAAALITDSVAPAITAKAGGGQDATLALSKNLNIVTTVATAGDSVTLPAASAGLRITIVNLGANNLAVFPYTSDSINDEAADASVTQDPETTVTYNCYTGVLWESDNEALDAFDKIYTGDGTVALPAYTFASDKDTGVYRIGANNIGVAVNGAKVVDVNTAGADITGRLTTSTSISATTSVTGTTAVISSGTLSYATLLTEGLTTGITAFAGGGQGSATALTTTLNNVTVCATAGDSVKLPAAAAGLTVTIKNSGATALDIFPATGDSIDALAVNLAVRIAPLSVATFRAIDATVWESNVDASLTLVAPTTNTGGLQLLAAASAGNTLTTITNASQAAARTYTIVDAGASANFVMSEGTATINGAKTFGSVIASAGVTASGTTATAGYIYTGTLVNTVGATPQTLDTLVGTALFNAIADTAAGTDVAATQVINNSLVTANTRAIVSVFSQTVAANSCMVVKNVTMGAGTITVTLHNAGSATSGAGGAVGISFTLYQL